MVAVRMRETCSQKGTYQAPQLAAIQGEWQVPDALLTEAGGARTAVMAESQTWLQPSFAFFHKFPTQEFPPNLSHFRHRLHPPADQRDVCVTEALVLFRVAESGVGVFVAGVVEFDGGYGRHVQAQAGEEVDALLADAVLPAVAVGGVSATGAFLVDADKGGEGDLRENFAFRQGGFQSPEHLQFVARHYRCLVIGQFLVFAGEDFFEHRFERFAGDRSKGRKTVMHGLPGLAF